jgi:hypothetical protein
MSCLTMLRFAACALLLVVVPASAALYKWKDENGRVVYGDTPPPGVSAERVNPAVPPADPNAVRDMAAKDAQFTKRQQERADADTKSDKAQADAKAKLDRCVQIRGNIETLRATQAGVYRYNERGEKVYLEPAEREKGIADAEKLLRDLNCPGAPAS